MRLLPQEIIRRKRDGDRLGIAEIADFVRGLVDGSIGEGQAAALAMAIFFRGMDAGERAALTRAMAGSGRTMRWDGIGKPVLDKHSTGGVGDKVSLMLAPIAAACGLAVPMISGRGLGHTGGTLDKLAAIPGYDAAPDPERFAAMVRDIGCAIIGQTADIAPADRMLYAVRDVTATVESLDLITASILSKKLAAGLDALVMDVKFGSGAFMATRDDARNLAESIVAVAKEAGMRCTALLTDMNEVLGSTAGNALEVREAIDYLTGAAREPRLHAVTVALAAEMLVLGGVAGDRTAGTAMAESVLSSGAAAERFAAMVAGLGGPKDLLEHPERHLAAAPLVRPVAAPRRGYVQAIEVRAIGLAIVALGGGRRRTADAIDPRVGLSEMAGLGSRVGPDRPLALCHAADASSADACAAAVAASVIIGEASPVTASPIAERVDA